VSTLRPEAVPISYTCEIPGSTVQIRIRLRVVRAIQYRLDPLLTPNPSSVCGILTGVRVRSKTTEITGFQPLTALDSATVEEAVTKTSAGSVVGFYRSTARGELHISEEDIRVVQTLVKDAVILLIEADQSGVGEAALVAGNQVVSRFPFDAQQLAALESGRGEATMERGSGVASGIGIIERRTWQPPRTVIFAAIAIVAGAGSYFLSAARHRATTGGASPIRQEKPPVRQLAAKSSLAFAVESRGPALFLTWNGQSPPIANASIGMMTIWSQGTIRSLTLTAEQLRSGSILYKPVSDQVEFQLAVMSGDQVTQESVIALLPERNDTQPASSEVRNSGSSKPIQTASVSSSGERGRSAESTDSPKRQGLRTFSPPAPLVKTNSSPLASLDQPPVALESKADKSDVFSLLGPPAAPPPATRETPPASETREMSIQTYTGMVVDAACATRATDDRCGVSRTTALFALRLPDGRILPFDSIGNDRVRNRKNKWVATASSGKPVQAKVSGAVLGDRLIVVSID
jgi:hypothetical protein